MKEWQVSNRALPGEVPKSLGLRYCDQDLHIWATKHLVEYPCHLCKTELVLSCYTHFSSCSYVYKAGWLMMHAIHHCSLESWVKSACLLSMGQLQLIDFRRMTMEEYCWSAKVEAKSSKYWSRRWILAEFVFLFNVSTRRASSCTISGRFCKSLSVFSEISALQFFNMQLV